jgi:hypothetical protein
VEPSLAKHQSDIVRGSAFERIPRGIGGTESGPRRAEAREIRLEAEDDVNGLIERIGLVAQVRLRSSVFTL